ncbi:MAG: M23 family metallopeptidase [Cyclobacteriaceae bacterium]|nr:M23 family metallopeptidase [Cyclobacteriaceae bacterium]
MANLYYRYNPKTFQYERVHPSGKKFLKRTTILFFIALITALPLTYWYIQKFASLEEQYLIHQNNELYADWSELEQEIDEAYATLNQFAEKDDGFYRTLLDLKPLPQSIREAGVGGVDRKLEAVTHYPRVNLGYERVEKLKHQVQVEQQSFDELSLKTDIQLSKRATRPAILPLHEKELIRLHTTFGNRFHPLLRIWRDHRGLDMTAAKGTPVFATGDGIVSRADYSDTYGLVIYIDHGFGYETRYAHLLKYELKLRQEVKRGQLVGYVGTTGQSDAYHLHYEVLFNGTQVNPIYFFQRDLDHKEYQKLVEHPTYKAPAQ